MEGTLNHGRRFVNSTAGITTGPSQISDSGSSSSSSTFTSSLSSLSISSTLSVAPMTLAASPAAPVPNPIVSIPTTSYTGQALLTAACAVPQFTAFPLSDGSYLAAPVIGCAEANPQCCPSLSETSNASAIPTASSIPLSDANSAIVSALNANPLTLCPADYTSIAGNCCPIGFSIYNQQIIDQTPCYSVLSQTLSIPSAASEQISSLSAIIAATATDPNPTVSVHIITDEIFALSLPLKNGVEIHNHNGGLSLGAKIGIGLGAGFGAIISIILITWLFFSMRKGSKNGHVKTLSNASRTSAWVDSTGASTAAPPKNSPFVTSVGPVINQTWAQNKGNSSYVDEGHIPGLGSEQSWPPTQPQYFRARTDSRPMQMAYSGQQTNGPNMYSELPGVASRSPTEAGREETGWYGQHQQQTYGQIGGGYNQSGGADYITSASLHDRAELGSTTPRPPGWR